MMWSHTSALAVIVAATFVAGTAGNGDAQQNAKPGSRMMHTGFVMCVAWSPDGKALASGSDDQTVRLWDALAGKEQATLSGHNPDMDLFNDYLIIAEKLHGTGKFVVYDLVEGKLMFPDG